MPNPAKQGEYDRFVKNGMRLMYSNKKGIPALVKSLDGNGNPVDGLANTLAAITLRLKGSAEKAGKPIDREVLLHGGGELLEQLADFSEQSGGHKYTDDELKSLAKIMVEGKAPQPQAPAAVPPPAPTGPELMPRGGYGS